MRRFRHACATGSVEELMTVLHGDAQLFRQQPLMIFDAFALAPVPLWLEDWSGLRRLAEQWRAEGMRDAGYRTVEEIDDWKTRDPIAALRNGACAAATSSRWSWTTWTSPGSITVGPSSVTCGGMSPASGSPKPARAAWSWAP